MTQTMEKEARKAGASVKAPRAEPEICGAVSPLWGEYFDAVLTIDDADVAHALSYLKALPEPPRSVNAMTGRDAVIGSMIELVLKPAGLRMLMTSISDFRRERGEHGLILGGALEALSSKPVGDYEVAEGQDPDVALLAAHLQGGDPECRAMAKNAIFALFVEGLATDEIRDLFHTHDEGMLRLAAHFDGSQPKPVRNVDLTEEEISALDADMEFDDLWGTWIAVNLQVSRKTLGAVRNHLRKQGEDLHNIQEEEDLADLLLEQLTYPPLNRELRDVAARQYAAGSIKRREFSFFKPVCEELDRFRKTPRHDGTQARDRMEVFVHLAGLPADETCELIADYFMALVCEATEDEFDRLVEIGLSHPELSSMARDLQKYRRQAKAEKALDDLEAIPGEVEAVPEPTPDVSSREEASEPKIAAPQAPSEAETPEPTAITQPESLRTPEETDNGDIKVMTIAPNSNLDTGTEWAGNARRLAALAEAAMGGEPDIAAAREMASLTAAAVAIAEAHALTRRRSDGSRALEIALSLVPVFEEHLKALRSKPNDDDVAEIKELCTRVDPKAEMPEGTQIEAIPETVGALLEDSRKALARAREILNEALKNDIDAFDVFPHVDLESKRATALYGEACGKVTALLQLCVDETGSENAAGEAEAGMPEEAKDEAQPVRTVAEPVALPETVESDPVQLHEERDEPASAEEVQVQPEPVMAETDTETEDGEEDVGQVLDPKDAALAQAVNEALVGYVERGAFGIAYHLSLAARAACAFDTVFTPDELRLAAVAGHLNLPSMQLSNAHAEIREALDNTLALVESDTYGKGETGRARRLMAFAAALEPALVGRDQSAINIVARTSIDKDWNELTFPLKEAIRGAAQGGMPLTIELFRGLKSAEDARSQLDDARGDVVDAVAGMARASFSGFAVATEIARNICDRKGECGDLLEHLKSPGEKKARNACAAFASRYGTIDGAHDLISTAKNRVPRARNINSIVGTARNSLTGMIMEIATACSHYAKAAEAVAESENDRRDRHVEVRDRVISAIDQAEQATAALRRDGAAPVLLSAIAFVEGTIARLRRMLDGEMPVPGHSDHLFAVHGWLALVPGVAFGESWLPTPYRPRAVMEAILNGLPPTACPGKLDADCVRAHCAARIAEGSFIGAELLGELADFLGIPGARGAVRSAIEAEVPKARAEILAAIETARRGLEGIERSGDPVEQEQAAQLTDVLDRIDPSALPVFLAPERRTEEPEENLVTVDLAAVRMHLENVRERTHEINARRRRQLMQDIDAVAATADPDSVARVTRMAQSDDLIVAAEWLDHLKSGMALPEDEIANHRFGAFFPEACSYGETLGADILKRGAEHAAEGRDLGPFTFSRVGPGRRAMAAEFLQSWIGIARGLSAQSRPGGSRTSEVISRTVEMLRRAGMVVSGSPEKAMERQAGGSTGVAFTLRMSVPHDDDSFVLPDFGSATKGRWRMLVCAALPTESELSEFMRIDHADGRMILLTSPLGTEARRRLAAIVKKRLLVVDASIALAAAAETELRPHTLIELAQPFSLANPYADHGKGAVPREMFVGRRAEIESIVDPWGACVVYGGRRYGKTATLKLVAETRHDPAQNIIAVHVDIQTLGTANGDVEGIWREVSHEMRDIFPRPVTDADAFKAGIKRYLNAEPGRRIILMLDEVDQFIVGDAKAGFNCFTQLQDVMESTSRRFKVVFAGLHNVSRVVRSGNVPLRQIASNPIRVGSFVQNEIGMAERLVTKPLAAMGYEFASRELVWRILTRCNYMPAAVQVACSRFLEILRLRPLDMRTQPPVIIDEAIVRAAFEDQRLNDKINATFHMTLENDPRYQLLVNIIASGDASSAIAGDLRDGMSVGDIFREAAYFWPQQFDNMDGYEMTRDVLDEMEGLGLLRRVGENWALRSPTIRRLMGDNERIEQKLLSYSMEPPLIDFDITTSRRWLEDVEWEHPAPLTLGQESKILAGTKPVHVITGCAAGDIGLLTASLRDHKTAFETHVHVPTVKRQSDLAIAIRDRAKLTGRHVVVVGADQPWTGDFLGEAAGAAATSEAVASGKVRILFVADAAKSLALSNDPRYAVLRGTKNSPVGWGILRPWSQTMFEQTSQKFGVSLVGPERTAFTEMTGGYNALSTEAMRAIVGAADKVEAIRKWFAVKAREPGFAESIGILAPLRDFFKEMEPLLGEKMTAAQIHETVFASSEYVHVAGLISYARRVGLVSVEQTEAKNLMIFNPIVAHYLEASR